MTAVRVSVTAEHIAKAGPWPRPPDPYQKDWKNPVELAIAERAGVEVTTDGGGANNGWIATIGARDSVLVVEIPGASDQLTAYWEGAAMEPFEFSIELDAWLVGMVHEALHS